MHDFETDGRETQELPPGPILNASALTSAQKRFPASWKANAASQNLSAAGTSQNCGAQGSRPRRPWKSILDGPSMLSGATRAPRRNVVPQTWLADLGRALQRLVKRSMGAGRERQVGPEQPTRKLVSAPGRRMPTGFEVVTS